MGKNKEVGAIHLEYMYIYFGEFAIVEPSEYIISEDI